MIVRVLTARVPAANVGEFNDLLRGLLDELWEQPGLVYAKLARRLDEVGGEEVVLFEEWRTPADLWVWTNGRLARPRLLPGTEDLIEDLLINHYEALDVVPEESDLARLEAGVPPVPNPARVPVDPPGRPRAAARAGGDGSGAAAGAGGAAADPPVADEQRSGA